MLKELKALRAAMVGIRDVGGVGEAWYKIKQNW